MVETALVMGFLVFLVLGCIDLFFLSAAYTTLSQVVREGVLAGVKMDALLDTEVGQQVRSSMCVTGNTEQHTNLQEQHPGYGNCDPAVPKSCGHYLIQWRLAKAFEGLSLGRVAVQAVITRCIPTSPSTKAIEVELTAKFNGYSPVFKAQDIRIRQRGIVAPVAPT